MSLSKGDKARLDTSSWNSREEKWELWFSGETFIADQHLLDWRNYILESHILLLYITLVFSI